VQNLSNAPLLFVTLFLDNYQIWKHIDGLDWELGSTAIQYLNQICVTAFIGEKLAIISENGKHLKGFARHCKLYFVFTFSFI